MLPENKKPPNFSFYTKSSGLLRSVKLEISYFSGISDLRFNLLAVCLLIPICLAVYWPVFSHQFLLMWDDQWVAINGYTSRGLDPENFWSVVTDFYNGQYAPINEFYYILLFSLHGYDPFLFHLAGLTIHISNVLLVYFFIYRLLKQANGFERLSIRRIALLTALIMALHPFLVESVSWVSASKILIYSFFYLIALNLYLKYIRAQKWMYYGFTFIFFIISFGGKEQAVTMPLCLLLLDYVVGRNFNDKKVWLEKVPFLILALLLGKLTIISQGVADTEAVYPIYQRIIFASYCLLEYFIKCVIPIKLSYLYPFPNQIGEPVPVRFWIYPFALLAGLLSLWNVWRQRWIFFGIAFFIIHIGLALNIIPTSRFAIIADRYVYVAAVGPFFLISLLLERFVLNRISVKPLFVGLSMLYIAALGIYAHQRCKVWHDPDTLKRELRGVLKERNDYEQLKLKFKG